MFHEANALAKLYSHESSNYQKVWTIALEEVEKPGLPDNNVLIKLRYASICGSDQHIFKGEFHPRTHCR